MFSNLFPLFWGKHLIHSNNKNYRLHYQLKALKKEDFRSSHKTTTTKKMVNLYITPKYFSLCFNHSYNYLLMQSFVHLVF